jgi:3-oxoacyl-[acyl-carrier-protein] synthase II
MMGASGAIEAVITVLSIKNSAAPPTANLNNVDPACKGVRHIKPGDNIKINIRSAVSNSFAFGGSNAVLVFKAPR